MINLPLHVWKSSGFSAVEQLKNRIYHDNNKMIILLTLLRMTPKLSPETAILLKKKKKITIDSRETILMRPSEMVYNFIIISSVI